MYHVIAYSKSLGAVTNSDITVVPDDVMVSANGHMIFTKPTNLLAAYAFGSTLSRLRFGNVALKQLGTNHIYPINPSDTVASPPAVMDLRDDPLILPQDEEITLEGSTSGIGPANIGAVLYISTPAWTRNLPGGVDAFVTRATVTSPAGTETSWSALSPMIFDQSLYNGSYAVVGAWVVAPGALAFRLRFPDAQSVDGKQMRPGGLVQQSLGAIPWPAQPGGLGEWGRFHTFSPPSIQLLADAVGGTYDVYLSLIYLGRGRDLVG